MAVGVPGEGRFGRARGHRDRRRSGERIRQGSAHAHGHRGAGGRGLGRLVGLALGPAAERLRFGIQAGRRAGLAPPTALLLSPDRRGASTPPGPPWREPAPSGGGGGSVLCVRGTGSTGGSNGGREGSNAPGTGVAVATSFLLRRHPLARLPGEGPGSPATPVGGPAQAEPSGREPVGVSHPGGVVGGPGGRGEPGEPEASPGQRPTSSVVAGGRGRAHRSFTDAPAGAGGATEAAAAAAGRHRSSGRRSHGGARPWCGLVLAGRGRIGGRSGRRCGRGTGYGPGGRGTGGRGHRWQSAGGSSRRGWRRAVGGRTGGGPRRVLAVAVAGVASVAVGHHRRRRRPLVASQPVRAGPDRDRRPDPA